MLSLAKIAAALFLINVACVASDNPCEGPHLHFVNDHAGCSRYFSCVNGVAHPVECPDNLWFNQDPLGCFPPNTHPCVPCPSTGVVRFGVVGSCSEYTLCINGIPIEGECASGTLFSRVEGRCALAESVDCDYLDCPLTGRKIVADRTSCSHYIVCVDGEKLARRECSENLLFDRELGSCARSENVVCPLVDMFTRFSGDALNFAGIPSAPIAIPTAPRPEPTTPSPPIQDEPPKAPPKLPPTKEEPTTVEPVLPPIIVRAWPSGPVTCPRSGIYLFGHHFVCSVFQTCTNGVLSISGCINGNHWSTITGTCEAPIRANCPHHGGLPG